MSETEQKYRVPWHGPAQPITDEMRNAWQPSFNDGQTMRVEFVPAPKTWWELLLSDPCEFLVRSFHGKI